MLEPERRALRERAAGTATGRPGFLALPPDALDCGRASATPPDGARGRRFSLRERRRHVPRPFRRGLRGETHGTAGLARHAAPRLPARGPVVADLPPARMGIRAGPTRHHARDAARLHELPVVAQPGGA